MIPKFPPKHSTQHPSVADPSVSDTSTDPSVATDLFDSRPGGDTREKSVFDRMRETLAHFSERCHEASEWLQQKWAALSHGTGIELHVGQISKPRSFKQRELPNELLHELSRIDAEKRKASAEVAFIQSLDLIPKEVPSDKDVDEQAFETYTKLCRQEGKQLGTISCPHNFNDAAVRYAKVFIGQVEKRKATAEQTQAEFWLSSADQEKFEGAKLLLAQQDDRESKKLAEAPPPPRSRTQHAPTLATLDNIPDLSTFDTEVQAIGYARLNQFFDDYNAMVNKGTVMMYRKDISTPTVAAAVDFLNKSYRSPAGVDWQMFVAATVLVREYRLHQEKIRSKN